jgi:ELWxxDGT repeat protein
MQRILRISLLSLLSSFAAGVAAQGSVTPFADLNTGSNTNASGSLGGHAAFFDGRTFFVASTRSTGSELWVTDGSALNTRLFADICPGRCGSTPQNFHVEGGNLFFSANDGRHGLELWRIASGATAPVLVADINPGAGSSSPAGFQRVQLRANATTVTRTFFVATRASEGRELWRLNAGASPTVALEFDFTPGPVSSQINTGFATLATFDMALSVVNASNVREVRSLVYDSATAPPTGSALVGGLDVSSNRAVAGGLIGLGGNVFVKLSVSPSFTDELWALHGNPLTATRVFASSGRINSLTASVPLARLFFANSATGANALMITDGTVAGTVPLGANTLSPQHLVSVGSQLVFTGNAAGSGRELMRSDGTSAGTGLLKELVPGSAGIGTAVAARALSGTRALIGFDADLWITDGTSAGTVEISGGTIEGDGAVFLLLPTTGNSALIGFQPEGASASEPFFTQGTIGSTVALGNLMSDVGDSFPTPGGVIGGRLLFTASLPGASGNHFSLPLGGAGAPQVLGSFFPFHGGRHFGKLWYRSLDGLVVTDGTAAGTTIATSVVPEIRNARCVIERNGARYFIGRDNSFSNVEIFRSLGTEATTVAVTDFSDSDVRGIEDNCFDKFYAIAGFGDKLFFVGDPNGEGKELHMLDANDQATRVADVRAGAGDARIRELIALDDRIVFNADDGIFGMEAWVSNGTAQGTQRLADLNPGVAGSEPESFVRVGSRIFFSALTAAGGRELHVTDGTAAGTGRVRDLFAGAGDALDPQTPVLIAVGDKLIFRAISSSDPACVLFESDGTSAGTRCAYDSSAHALGPVLEAVALASGAVVFTAARRAPDDGEEIRVLFNRQLLAVAGHDVAAGSAGSAPEDLFVDGDTVYFRADDGLTGSELWRLTLPDLSALFGSGFE